MDDDHDIPGVRETAKVFKTGGSQAVRLPKEFRLPGDRVRVRREGASVVLTPIPRTKEEIEAWLTSIQMPDFMEGGREQEMLDFEPKVSFDD